MCQICEGVHSVMIDITTILHLNEFMRGRQWRYCFRKLFFVSASKYRDGDTDYRWLLSSSMFVGTVDIPPTKQLLFSLWEVVVDI